MLALNYLLFLQSALLPPFQSSLLGGVGVVEVTVGAVAAAVLIRGDVESSHFGLLHADRKCASGAGFLLSLAAYWPSRLQACEGRGGVRTAAPARPRPRDAAGRRSAADSSPARRVEKYQASEGRGRGEGRKSTDEGDRENKDAPAAAAPSSHLGAEPGVPLGRSMFTSDTPSPPAAVGPRSPAPPLPREELMQYRGAIVKPSPLASFPLVRIDFTFGSLDLACSSRERPCARADPRFP